MPWQDPTPKVVQVVQNGNGCAKFKLKETSLEQRSWLRQSRSVRFWRSKHNTPMPIVMRLLQDVGESRARRIHDQCGCTHQAQHDSSTLKLPRLYLVRVAMRCEVFAVAIEESILRAEVGIGRCKNHLLMLDRSRLRNDFQSDDLHRTHPRS